MKINASGRWNFLRMISNIKPGNASAVRNQLSVTCPRLSRINPTAADISFSDSKKSALRWDEYASNIFEAPCRSSIKINQGAATNNARIRMPNAIGSRDGFHSAIRQASPTSAAKRTYNRSEERRVGKECRYRMAPY